MIFLKRDQGNSHGNGDGSKLRTFHFERGDEHLFMKAFLMFLSPKGTCFSWFFPIPPNRAHVFPNKNIMSLQLSLSDMRYHSDMEHTFQKYNHPLCSHTGISMSLYLNFHGQMLMSRFSPTTPSEPPRHRRICIASPSFGLGSLAIWSCGTTTRQVGSVTVVLHVVECWVFFMF